MQRSRRAAVVYATLTGLLAAVAITAGATAAAANTAGFCSASGAQASCTETRGEQLGQGSQGRDLDVQRR